MAGRPTKYDEKYCDDIIAFFTNEKASGNFPQYQNYAEHIGVHVDTLIEWTKQYDKFSEAYIRARQIAEADLVAGGLTNKYNSQFAQFIAKNNFGYKDKVEYDVNAAVTIIDDMPKDV